MTDEPCTNFIINCVGEFLASEQLNISWGKTVPSGTMDRGFTVQPSHV